MVGKWIEGGFGTASIIIRDGTPFLIRKFTGSGSMEQELEEKPSAKGRRFDLNSGIGDYILINQRGELLFLNDHHDGVITLTKVN